MKDKLEKIIGGQDLSFEESRQSMGCIMDGTANQAEIAAWLIALKIKGETAEEVAGSAQAMRERSIKISSGKRGAIDVCGTGGDNSGTFNISTATAFVVAAAGIPVAKHGNRSISSKSGSADVMKALGININQPPQRAQAALEEIGITFLFAPDYHPAMKQVAPVRRELGMKTIFNILGPLTNPAGTKRQLIGTFNRKAAQTMVRAAQLLGMERVCFVCTADRYDEITLSQPTDIFEYEKDHELKQYQIDHTTFGYPPIDPGNISGNSPEENAAILLNLFVKKERDAIFQVIAANAAMALWIAGQDGDIRRCVAIAEEAILSDAALKKLQQLREFV
jgi:anthranilate phosphoribosyltransferase